MKKKFIFFALALMALSQVAFAHEFPALVRVNGDFIQGEVIVHEETNYFPARVLADVLGVITEWDEESETAYFYKGDKRVVIRDESVYIFIAGQPQGAQDFAAYNYNWSTYLPLEFFVEFFGYQLSYAEQLKIFDIVADDVTVLESHLAPAGESQDELKTLARIINIEARDASIYKRTAVANVVLNRVKSPNFPNSVYDVVKQRGQFPPAYYSYFDTFEPDLASYVAALQAFNGHNNIENCLYFNLAPFKWKSESDYYGEIEGDYFYR